MARLQNFNKIKFKPFRIQKGQLVAGNFYKDRKGNKIMYQSHLKGPKFSYFEILKEEPNPNFGKYQEYLDSGYVLSFGGEFLETINGSYRIDVASFENPTRSYVLAYWENLDHDEKSPDLKFVGTRPFDLTQEERLIFMDLAEVCQSEIMEQLNAFDEYE